MCTMDVVSCKISVCVKLNAAGQNLSPDLLLSVLFCISVT